ncbi:MAG: 50S ribosomal protein L18e [Candidatus Micrarchaeota archaeon]|nr:50S ribosomal protein L18e [Candidatus Micrarchaeota archaeon]
MRINVERQDLKDWLQELKGASRGERNAKLWKRVLELSAVPARSRRSVNIYKINKYTKDGDNVVVPGKVLSEGRMDHKVNITAIEFSASALVRLRDSQCTVRGLGDMLKEKGIKLVI